VAVVAAATQLRGEKSAAEGTPDRHGDAGTPKLSLVVRGEGTSNSLTRWGGEVVRSPLAFSRFLALVLGVAGAKPDDENPCRSEQAEPMVERLPQISIRALSFSRKSSLTRGLSMGVAEELCILIHSAKFGDLPSGSAPNLSRSS